MDSRQLHYFRTVVDTGSFTKAAESLGLTQPSLSLAIRKLEDDLEAHLLNRNRAGATPTEAGKYLYQVASRMDSLFDDAQRRVSDITAGIFGSVRIASMPVFNWDFMPEVLHRVLEAHPSLDISLEDPKPTTAIEYVETGKSDIGLVALAEPKEFIAHYRTVFSVEHVSDLEYRLAVPERLSHLPETVSLKDLVGETLILPFGGQKFADLTPMMEDLWDKDPSTKPQRIIHTSTMHAAIPLVAGGVGVALMSENASTMAGSQLTLKRIADPLPPAGAVAFHLQQRTLSPAAQYLFEELLKVGREN
ncbi:LysR family transcriptional regulator [Corynebacterium lubricantis]|uniref:LysR family transcriptional regulator n=1 Tax=Corynebacterium lubricantis TaxID=541095 RepID=UPI0003660954|nr:LysR family transcriptional regulator [Corynebacterium lubricantis]